MPQPLQVRFGQIVRLRRVAAGLSQEELGDRTNLSRNYIGMVERGETNPTLLVLQVLATAMETTMSSLVMDLEGTVAKVAPTKGRTTRKK